MKIRPKTVTPIMPKKTATPSAWRISAPAPLAKASGRDAEDEGEGGHQDRPQPGAAGLRGGLVPLEAVLQLALAGELDDQDGVLGRQADQHDQADLGQDVVVHAAAG